MAYSGKKSINMRYCRDFASHQYFIFKKVWPIQVSRCVICLDTILWNHQNTLTLLRAPETDIEDLNVSVLTGCER